MKRLALSIIAIAGILVACHSISSNKDFIPGTYTNHAESPYSQADDTLSIVQAGTDNTIYAITRKTGYYRIVNGKPDSLRHQLKRWAATWDEQKQQLVILQTGGILTFQRSGSLLYGSSEYQKR